MTSNTLIRSAVATALAAGCATVAHGAALSGYGTNTNVNVYISGSTAVTNTLAAIINPANGISPNVCVSGTFTQYKVSAAINSAGNPIGGADEVLWYCNASTGSGVNPSGSTTIWLAIFKEDTAGSINGVQPLIAASQGTATNLTYLSPTSSNFTQCIASASACGTGDFQQNVIPTGGIADVEAALLRRIGPPAGIDGTPVPSGQVSSLLSYREGLDVVWGVAVTKNLYYALQTAENLGSGGTAVSGCSTANNDSTLCAPTLSKAQIASIFLGSGAGNAALFNWNQIVGISNSTDNNVYVCRRDVGSGTEGSFEAYFLGARCGISDETMQAQDGQFFIESASSGGVRTCLQAFYTPSNTIAITPFNEESATTTYPPFTPPGNQWALGIVSTEITPANLSSAGDSFRIVAVDGVLPTLANVVNGYYPYWGTDAIYQVKSGSNIPSGNPNTIFQAVTNVLGHPAATKIIDATFDSAHWGQGGDLAPATLYGPFSYSANPVTTALVQANPYNLFTKAPSGSTNNCDTPALYQKSGTTENTAAEKTLHGGTSVNVN